MTPATHLLAPSTVSTESTSILSLPTVLLTSTTLSVTRVLAPMMLVCSIAHMFPSRWFVPLERTPSSPRLALRPVMVLSPTHLLRVMSITKVWVVSILTPTATIREYAFRTSCDIIDIRVKEVLRGLRTPLFLCQ